MALRHSVAAILRVAIARKRCVIISINSLAPALVPLDGGDCRAESLPHANIAEHINRSNPWTMSPASLSVMDIKHARRLRMVQRGSGRWGVGQGLGRDSTSAASQLSLVSFLLPTPHHCCLV